jgi:uncharacterized protein YdaL
MMKYKHVILVMLSLVLSYIVISPTYAQNSSKCVRIYYDQPDKTTTSGRGYAIIVQNLLGHFPKYQQYISPIQAYQKGDIDKCDATIYIGSNYYEDTQPFQRVFMADFVATKKNVVWLGYNVWRLGKDNLQKIWGVNFQGINHNKNKWMEPKAGYGAYTYKDKLFNMFSKTDPSDFPPQNDTVKLLPVNNDNSIVISWALQDEQGGKIPYVIRKDNHWYIADVPFAYMHESHPYLIFTDLLFDILNEPARNKKLALVRIEDVSATTNPAYIKNLADMLSRLKVPFAIALIPIYKDPLHAYGYPPYTELPSSKPFIEAIQYAVSRGGTIIMHGVTHQYDHKKDPYTGVSADDFEFWDGSKKKPIKEDGIKYVLERLETGVGLINKAGFKVSGWESPHYTASNLDYFLFGQAFTWNVGRISYFVSRVCHLSLLPETLTLDRNIINPETNAKRLQYLSGMKIVSIPGTEQVGQYFPYEIYGDYYDQRIVPENLGNIEPVVNEQVKSTRNVDDIIRNASRNVVLRDIWASFFIHATLLNTPKEGGIAKKPGDTSELERLVKSIKGLGYEFIDLKSWLKANTKPKRPLPIEVVLPPIKC